MKNNKNMRSISFASAILFTAATAFAAAGDSLVQEQESMINKLDSMDASVLGLRLNGTAKAGVVTSIAESDQFSDDSPTQETQAFTDVNLSLKARPSSESEIRVDVRLHKDWQNAFDENNNPIIGHWFSYDGKIFDKHLAFNLGYMRVGFTPLTLYTPQTLMLQEPEIFAANRVEALAQRNLDTTTNRLMQGVNADYHSGKLGFIDDIHAQITGARMRNTAKKQDQVFFDFDFSDRYFYGGRLGVETYGLYVGGNFTDIFDRKKSRRSRAVSPKDTVYYDNNMVYSTDFGFDSKGILSGLPVNFGFNGEFAKSHWTVDYDYMAEFPVTKRMIAEGLAYNPDGSSEFIVYMRNYATTKTDYVNEDYAKEERKISFNVEPYVKGDVAGVGFDLKAMYLQTDEDFWSEMASSPNYQGNAVILNANALYTMSADSSLISDFGMSSLENLYFSVYNSNPLNANNLMTSGSKNVLSASDESNYLYSRLDNNYKNAHFYRNGYNASSLKKMEAAEAMFALDPSVNMSMPFGIATPDRKGFNVSLDLSWRDAITLNGRFSKMNQGAVVTGVDEKGVLETDENNYTQYAMGVGIDVGEFIPSLDRKLLIQGSYDHTEEDAYMERTSDRMMAGATLDIWGPITLLAGYQVSNKEFGKALAINASAAVTKAEESLLLAGPRIRIAPNSYLTAQYGLLTDKLSYDMFESVEDGGMNKVSKELSIDKTVIVANVLVNF
ncbi:MAG: hypothetical protein MJY47_04470 [Fibrobacter sp.]|nr:hypothetical protein [Fibrobacter sp.]